MPRILLLSDTHSYIGDDILLYADECDEIWHAGDIGSVEVVDTLAAFRPLRIVYGNIDAQDIRHHLREDEIFECGGVKVFITHIGGYPGRYARGIASILNQIKPDLFICGHSHILKVMKDEKRDLIHMNPGACGHHGFHQIRTMLRFSLENGQITDVEVIELGRRGQIVQ